MKKIYLVLFTAFLISSCDNDEVESRPYARIRTLSVVIGATNIQAIGEIKTINPSISEFGFVWSLKNDSPINVNQDYKIKASQTPAIGTYEMIISENLERGKTYYLKAYAVSNGYTVFGDIIKFTF
ncbi:MAG: hypothetical protein MUF28_15570 [Ignavibacterium sp.]|jgi:hypothetical protein|nr:hypothetical protein [Ignavibacterium sp.]